MGFPSPALDYAESRMSLQTICMTNDSGILDTDAGVAIIEPVIKKRDGDVLLILSGGRTQFARLAGSVLVVEDGETIEGEDMEEVEVLGRVTFFINRAADDGYPCI